MEKIEKAFAQLWEDLFTTPVHLDSILSRQTPSQKRILAQIVPIILLRPSSVGEALGVGVPFQEPWSLSTSEQAGWRPARMMAERLYEGMFRGLPNIQPNQEDFPPVMIDEWTKTWGPEVCSYLWNTLAKEPPLSLRAARKTGALTLLKNLTSKGPLPVKAEVSDISPFGLRLSGYASVLKTKDYEDGNFEIQDEGSQLMSLFALWPEIYGKALSQVPGPVGSVKNRIDNFENPPSIKDFGAHRTIVDACSGAGGKALAMADALGGRAKIFAYDVSQRKLQSLRRRATRAGWNNIKTAAVVENQELESLSAFRGKADVVLVDAPCSGWGVLRRNPDIKWRQSPESLARMPEIQLRLLKVYSELVKPSGRLVFGVCTFRQAETTEIVAKFLAEKPEFRSQIGGFFGPGPSDGFYMHSFVREG